jgi:alpha-D-ribose 1-methylphosphonate 5-triphosphate synthase subunit PhnL
MGFSGGEKCRLRNALKIFMHLHLLFLNEPMCSTNKTENFGVTGLYCLLVLVVITVEEIGTTIATT